jgi:Ras-related protein Rab-5C
MTEIEEEEDDEKKAIPCKVVLVGESGVGKTSIISRYLTNTFNENVGSTPGANFTTKIVYLKDENQSIKYEIWDTAGQEKYRSLAKVFYKNATVCILVYEITRRSSFKELKKFWVNEVLNNASKDISKKILFT